MEPRQPVNVFHFHNGRGGGVWSVIKNLITYSDNPLIKNHVVHYLAIGQTGNFHFSELPPSIVQMELRYSPQDNFYTTCNRLAATLFGPADIIVAHNWMELGMASHLGLPNPVIYYAHGDYDYYYQLAQKHRGVIDEVVVIAASIKEKMGSYLMDFNIPVNYIRFPVPEVGFRKEKLPGSVLFVGRLEEGKGYPVLIDVARQAAAKHILLHWYIVGEGEVNWLNSHPWPEEVPHTHFGALPNNSVLELMAEMEIILLPSTHEGMPIVIIEAMKAGVIPLVSDIPGGIQELVLNDETGYKLQREDVPGFVEKISLLQRKEKRDQLSARAENFATRNFEPYKNTLQFEEQILALANRKKRNKARRKVYGSRLDMPWIPNKLVRIIRKINK
ncbi:MAG: glycosyltransferase family 4 protein [Chitinophagaceae bacterium]|nr:glycosyltransferase family 4 protein [Bacteroidota bacterium]MCC6256838.1 glycosyltransferase family 4 protein [Chitinophagaceae bacterium]MCW5916982.1 glycosyltransferase family 4 protein [Ferruginibacter sp.]